MQIMEQGDTYDDEDVTDEVESEDEEESTEGSEDTDGGITSIYGIPIKWVVIGGAGILVLLVALIVIVFWVRSREDDSEEYVYEGEDYYVEEEEVVYNDGDIVDGMIWSDEYGGLVTEDVYYGGDTSEPEATENPLDDEQRKTLRSLGYTGDEIEWALSNAISFDSLVAEAEALQDEKAKEALARMSDTAGEEYKTLMNVTYLSEKDNPFVMLSDEEMQTEVKRFEKYVNADFVKCPTKGPQLWLKCRIANDACVWYYVSPIRWAQLPESGNIVLALSGYYYKDVMYVTEIHEQNSSLSTIDASDVRPQLPSSAELSEPEPVPEPDDVEEEEEEEVPPPSDVAEYIESQDEDEE